MKISFTNSKTKYIIASLLLLITILSFIFSSFFAFDLSKWIALPIIFLLELEVFLLLIFKIELSTKVNRILSVSYLIVFPYISLMCVEYLQKSTYLGSLKANIVNYLIFLAHIF